MELKQVKVRQLIPNRYRNIRKYPILKPKVDALIDSMKTTSAWPNIEARPASGGKFEIAYGHHRRVAMEKLLGKNGLVWIIVSEFTNNEMLKKMASENMQEWAASATVIQETIKATVEAFAKGEIELPKVLPSTTNLKKQHMIAPSFSVHYSGTLPANAFTAVTIATFLGWTGRGGSTGLQAQGKVKTAIKALRLIEEKVVDEEHFKDLNLSEAHMVEKQAREAKERTLNKGGSEEEAKKQGRLAADRVASQFTPEVKKSRTKAVAIEATQPFEPNFWKFVPDMLEFTDSLTKQISRLFTNEDKLGRELNEIIKFQKDAAGTRELRGLEIEIGLLVNRVKSIKERLKGEKVEKGVAV